MTTAKGQQSYTNLDDHSINFHKHVTILPGSFPSYVYTVRICKEDFAIDF